ncbi:MAG TPA: Crp/Fnr family transcriptional regulator [Acetobacteraceae bacterium]|nr:Crp/Fnr family transcriptional regulator [Acetobacteraceae bacterium]
MNGEVKETALSERARLLSKVPFFKGLHARDFEALAAQMHERPMRAGEVLFRRDDPGASMLAIIAGEVRVVLPSADGRDQVIKLFRSGEVFGEIALLDGGPRTADAIAETNGRLLVVGRRDLLRLLKEDDGLALRIIVLLCERLRSTDRLLDLMLFHDTSARLASVILDLSSARPGRRLDITQRALGEIVGAARETVNKKLREWQEQGAISLEPGRITVINPAPLERHIPHAAAATLSV